MTDRRMCVIKRLFVYAHCFIVPNDKISIIGHSLGRNIVCFSSRPTICAACLPSMIMQALV
jgi:hypothetical protein